ncbi:MAG: CehA/McbA family metallohydrolase, partial [Planctomycetales bacterium]|nr:CehA/McbA family metallohydrolase [Planctomycetales bacterium]
MNNSGWIRSHGQSWFERLTRAGLVVRGSLLAGLVCVSLLTTSVRAQEEDTVVQGVAAQPLRAQVTRVRDALEFLGQPLPATTIAELNAAIELPEEESAERLQEILDPLVLVHVHVNPESRVKVAAGAGAPTLVEQGWTVFLVKVNNEAGVTAGLRVSSPNANPIHVRSTGAARAEPEVTETELDNRWMDVRTFDDRPLTPNLSGLLVEYRLIQVYSRDSGEREATLAFDVGQGTQDLGFRNELPILFRAAPAVKVTLDVIDHDGQPVTAQFVFRDKLGRIYPARSRRLAPDFFFHDQIYRADGESVQLPPGEYEVSWSRGPEYVTQTRSIQVPAVAEHRESFRLQRWIHLAPMAWYSGDHHVHAAGCAHYQSPTEGVTPEDMMRHILGEDLNVGCVLSWGPCWYYQKEFFEGGVHQLSQPQYLMRYDVEVSGFPSSHAGHLCLLNLREDDYEWPEPTKFQWRYGPEGGEFDGTKTSYIGEWPSWDLPVLRWGKEQGGVVGFSHSGWGLQVNSTELPNYEMPRFDGIGANEYVVDVCHDVVDFISTVDTPAVWELNIWYHTLNCGYTARISGETDFPCIYGERVGLGRVYVKLPPGSDLTYEAWVHGLKEGRSYVGDGRSHLVDFRIGDFEVGTPGDDGRTSVLRAESGKSLEVRVNAAALLADVPNDFIRNRPLDQQPYWHIERARIGDSSRVPVELIVNGQVVERREIEADGDM